MCDDGATPYGEHMKDSARQQAVVVASVATITARMPLSVEIDGLVLSLQPVSNTEDGHARFVGTWSSSGVSGDADVDVRRAGGAMSTLQVSLSPASGGMRAWRWTLSRRTESAAALALGLTRSVEGRPLIATRPTEVPKHRAVRIAVPAAALVFL